jgi:hypothetical protein
MCCYRKSNDDALIELLKGLADLPAEDDAAFQGRMQALYEEVVDYKGTLEGQGRNHLSNLNILGSVQRTKLDKAFTQAVDATVEELKNLFESGLLSSDTLLFHETWCFQDAELLARVSEVCGC